MKTNLPLKHGGNWLFSFLFLLCFLAIPRVGAADNVNLPAIYRSYYGGTYNEKDMQIYLHRTRDKIIDGRYVSNHYKKARSLRGTISNNMIHLETIYGMPKESFDLKLETTRLVGKWKRGNIVRNTELSLVDENIEYSKDPNHPFVGDWSSWGQGVLMLRMSLYNHDLENNSSLHLALSRNNDVQEFHAYPKDIKMLTKNKAIVRIGNINAEIIHDPEYNAVTLKMGNWGTYQLDMNMEILDKVSLLYDMDDEEKAAYFQDEKLAMQKEKPSRRNSGNAAKKEAWEEEDISMDGLDENISMDGLDEETDEQNQSKAIDNKAVEIPARFPGGEAAMLHYISTHVVYPKQALKKDIQGIVIVRFAIEPDGSIGDAEIVKSVHALLDAEAIRVVKSLPRFTPARQKGRPVRVHFTLPIYFRLT